MAWYKENGILDAKEITRITSRHATIYCLYCKFLFQICTNVITKSFYFYSIQNQKYFKTCKCLGKFSYCRSPIPDLLPIPRYYLLSKYLCEILLKYCSPPFYKAAVLSTDV